MSVGRGGAFGGSRVLASLLALFAVLVVVSPVHAQSSAAAQALFDEAVALRTAGKIDQACPKFEESLRLEPTVGTRFNLADCFERQGKTASAWSQFLQVAADTERAGEPERAKAARARAKRVEPRLSRMVISPVSPATGLSVQRNGIQVGSAQWGTALPVDPGSHEVVAIAPNKKRWTTTVQVSGEGQRVTVDIPMLEDAPAGSFTPLPAPGGPGPQPQPGSESSSTPMILGLTIGGLGVVGLAVGTAMGVTALGKKNEVDDLCPDLNNCTENGIAVNDEAKSAALVSTVGFIAGGVLLVTGVVLWVALPSTSEGTSVGLSVSPTGASLVGRF